LLAQSAFLGIVTSTLGLTRRKVGRRVRETAFVTPW
jgi:hypothetical protein